MHFFGTISIHLKNSLHQERITQKLPFSRESLGTEAVFYVAQNLNIQSNYITSYTLEPYMR